MNTRKLSLIAAALMLFSLFAVSAMAQYGGDEKEVNGDPIRDRDGTGIYCPNNGISATGVCDGSNCNGCDGTCPNNGVCDGDCDGPGPYGPQAGRK